MMRDQASRNPLARLRTHLDDVDRVCPACSYEDDEGHWSVATDGGEVCYRHACPNCGNVERRSILL